MTPDAVPASGIWASIVVFAVHNIEETIGIEAWAAAHFPPKIAWRYRTGPFFVASGLLWILFAAVAVLALTSQGAAILVLFALAFAAVVANAIVHVIAAPLFGKTPPGFWSALTLVLPLGAWLGWQAVTGALLTPGQTVLILLAGAVLQQPLAVCAIFIANSLPRFRRTQKGDPRT